MVELSPDLALYAAELSLTHHLAMADAMIYATALSRGATLVTSDEDFEKLPEVIYLPKE